MKLGMSGNRSGITKNAKNTLLRFFEDNEIDEVHHGDCVGSDKDFHDVCATKEFKIVIHPPKNNKMRANCISEHILPAKDYLDRNHDIVDFTDMLVAFPSSETEEIRSGTWATIRYAKKKNKKILLIFPDGKSKNVGK